MNWWIVGGIVALVLLIWLASRLGWIDLSNKTRRGGPIGNAFGVVDEVFAPHRHEIEVQREKEAVLPVEKPIPGDGDLGIAAIAESDPDAAPDERFDGTVRIDV
ncbi:hypothetical protein E6C70_12160 [Glaciibacter flavus]|uniref:Uncharacterized protein n=1 Tax=Orlajensenia flava TaxID=2565934 RepID=A0A4S4FSM5_9MICO|nr:hypothetical protein [Glaciibacter flavus]THG32506.1 hypothetical protein E6C70_12160 [Glaciibacter flavus]